MNLKFYKTGTKPTTVGSLWFNPTTKRIELITGTSTSDVYGSDIQDATYSNDILTIEKIDGSAITIDLSDYATSSELENSLANKLNKIKVNNSTVNSVNLNIVGSGGTTVSNNSGTITISSETAPTSFDASAITSGTIALERLPKGALERLFIVSSENDAMRADCQEGDTVQVTGNDNKMYFCVNGSATTFANKFREYTAGAATSVPWSGITGRPNVEDGAQKNVQSDWNAISGDAFILNKPTIPTKTSQLTNDSDFATQTVITTTLATKADKTEVEALQSLIDTLNPGYQFMGVATPSTNPGTPDQKVFYIADPGIYPHFNFSIDNEKIGVFKYDTEWHIETFTSPLLGEVKKLDSAISGKSIPFIDGYYFKNQSLTIVPNVDFSYCKIPVRAGEKYILTGSNLGSLLAALYNEVSADEQTLYLSSTITQASNLEYTVVNDGWLYINVGTDKDHSVVYKLFLKEDVDSIKENALIAAIASEAFQYLSITKTSGVISSASIKWPDGVNGVMTITYSNGLPVRIDYTHSGDTYRQIITYSGGEVSNTEIIKL